ncbi:hypothetical protein O3P69_020067 [Scylla paramamosain]|uniref:Ig-like domain-containing protein n=1 Tax=Scylla paramamosain TaxID=85552 RepID=A0AAW0TK85_SCYPA
MKGLFCFSLTYRVLQAGSSLVLECVVTHTGAPPPAVLWLRNALPLHYDSPRGGVSMQVEKSLEHTTSRLSLSAVREEDSANYTCVPVNSSSAVAAAASVAVHVNTADELRAAVHQGGLSSAPPPPMGSLHCSITLALAMAVVVVVVLRRPRHIAVRRVRQNKLDETQVQELAAESVGEFRV